MFFNDPEELEEYLAPISGDVLIRPAVGSFFNTEITMKGLESVGFFSVSANSFKAVKEPQNDFYGLSIPLQTNFTVSEYGGDQVYESPTAHLLLPGRTFDFTAKRDCHCLVANFLAAAS